MLYIWIEMNPSFLSTAPGTCQGKWHNTVGNSLYRQMRKTVSFPMVCYVSNGADRVEVSNIGVVHSYTFFVSQPEHFSLAVDLVHNFNVGLETVQ